jgi:hypothetical protein
MSFLAVTYFSELEAIDRGDTRGDPLEQLINQEQEGEYEWNSSEQLCSHAKRVTCSCQMTAAAQPRGYRVTKYQVTQGRASQVTMTTVRAQLRGRMAG